MTAVHAEPTAPGTPETPAPVRAPEPAPGATCSQATAERILRTTRDRVVGMTLTGRAWPTEHTADLMSLLLELDNEVAFITT